MSKSSSLVFSIILISVLFIFSSFIVESADIYKELSISLPEGYPEDLVPLIDDYVVSRSENIAKDNYHEMNLKYLSNISVSDIVAFYQEKFKENNIEVVNMLGSYVLNFKLADKTVKIRISEETSNDNYQTSVNINIKGDFKLDSFEQKPDKESLDSANKNINGIEKLPDGFAIEMIPIYSNSEITDVEDYEELLIIQFNTKDDKEMVRKFYESYLQNYKLKEKAQFITKGLNYYLMGEVDEQILKFTIYDYSLYFESEDYSTIVNLGIEAFE